jgi:hypothetical protein
VYAQEEIYNKIQSFIYLFKVVAYILIRDQDCSFIILSGSVLGDRFDSW